jgi:anti-sigma factor ChrR (cupin superfamily)
MNMSKHDERLDSVAAYALGTLDAADRQVVVFHMQICRTCRSEYEALRPMVTAVGSAACREAMPSPLLKARVMKEIRAIEGRGRQ